jgi:Carboxypeptidase regulatory-like domain
VRDVRRLARRRAVFDGVELQSSAQGGGNVRHLSRIGMAVLLVSVLASAQLYAAKKAEDSNLPRNLSGTVLDQANRAVPGAVVYLKNQLTLGIITYITGNDGAYRFNNLSPDINYSVYAKADGRRSPFRSLSSFDTRKQVRINLRLGK